MDRGRFGELVERLGADAEARLRSVFSSMQRDRSSRLFFLINPKQVAAAEAKVFLAEGEEARLITFPFEAGFLPCMDFRGMDEGEALAKIRTLSSPSSRILGSYAASLQSIRNALVTLTGKKIDLAEASRIVRRTILRNKAAFRYKETSKFCVVCGHYAVSPIEVEVRLPCEERHRYVEASVFKIDDVVMLAWEEGIVLEGYVSAVLKAEGWNAVISSDVVGIHGSRHEIDVLAERDDNYLIAECKHLAPYNEVSYDDIMLGFGKMVVIESALRATYAERGLAIKRVFKAFVTTGKLARTKMVRDMLLESPEFLVVEREDVVNGLRALRRRLRKATSVGD